MYIDTESKYTLVGGIFGFMTFIMYLESRHMGNIIIREGAFVPLNILHYMINPFKSRYLWHPTLWRANWIIMSAVGAAVGWSVHGIQNYLSS